MSLHLLLRKSKLYLDVPAKSTLLQLLSRVLFFLWSVEIHFLPEVNPVTPTAQPGISGIVKLAPVLALP